MLGIEKIKKAIDKVTGLVETLFTIFEDGKVTLFETIPVLQDLIGLWSVAKEFGQIKDEYLDLTPEERQER